MRKRVIGLVLLVVVMLGSVGYNYFQTGSIEPRPRSNVNYKPITLKGYVGGEKLGFLRDPEVQDILENRYKITLDSTKAGSIEMVRMSTDDVDFLWPSSQVALEIYKSENRSLVKDELIFNSPIVFYSWNIVADALEREDIVERIDNSYYVVDMPALVALVQNETAWKDLGVPQLYGKITIVSTDPTKSNSGNQFSGLLANTLNGGQVVDEITIEQYLPAIDTFFGRLGFLHHSSGDLFSQYLKQGVGAYPLVVGYENQIVEFSLENKKSLPMIKEKVRILYPQPTVWSSHPLIVLNDDATRLIDALMDPEIQGLAWSKHGFRSGLMGVVDDTSVLEVAGIPETIEMVIPMPKASVMEQIIDTLED